MPTTAFIALDGIEQLDPPSCGLPPHTMLDLDASAEPTVLDRATRHLEPLLEHQLRSCWLDGSRLVLVGFGYGGTLALHMSLRQGWSCVGVLAFTAKLRPLPRILRVDHKIRLIECVGDGHIGHSSLRDVVALLTARGIDTRGVLLAGSALSDKAIRHGGAYLVELVATAQRGEPFHVDREISDAPYIIVPPTCAARGYPDGVEVPCWTGPSPCPPSSPPPLSGSRLSPSHSPSVSASAGARRRAPRSRR